MHPRAQELIERLQLEPHPEGGWYRQTFKSASRVTRHADGAERSALTTIYFLLVAGTYSAWHVVQSDEAWHFYEGDPLELLLRGGQAILPVPFVKASGQKGTGRIACPPQDRESVVLDANHRMHVVPAGVWQAARPMGAYALVGCTVGPGFEFEDFAMQSGPI